MSIKDIGDSTRRQKCIVSDIMHFLVPDKESNSVSLAETARFHALIADPFKLSKSDSREWKSSLSTSLKCAGDPGRALNDDSMNKPIALFSKNTNSQSAIYFTTENTFGLEKLALRDASDATIKPFVKRFKLSFSSCLFSCHRRKAQASVTGLLLS